jgi:hypothetical protein
MSFVMIPTYQKDRTDATPTTIAEPQADCGAAGLTSSLALEGGGAKPKPVAPDIALSVWLADDAPDRSSQFSAVGCQYRPPTQTRSNGNASEQQEAERYQEQDVEPGHMRILAIMARMSHEEQRVNGARMQDQPGRAPPHGLDPFVRQENHARLTLAETPLPRTGSTP